MVPLADWKSCFKSFLVTGGSKIQSWVICISTVIQITDIVQNNVLSVLPFWCEGKNTSGLWFSAGDSSSLVRKREIEQKTPWFRIVISVLYEIRSRYRFARSTLNSAHNRVPHLTSRNECTSAISKRDIVHFFFHRPIPPPGDGNGSYRRQYGASPGFTTLLKDNHFSVEKLWVSTFLLANCATGNEPIML